MLWPVVPAAVVELAHIAINLAGGAFEHPAHCAPLDDDPGDLRANDLCDRIYLEYRFDHHYAPNSGHVGAEHGGKTAVADRTGNAVGFMRLYNAYRDPAQRGFFTSGWTEIRQMAQVGFFLNVLVFLLVSAMSYAGIYFVRGIDPTVFPAWAAP